MFAIGALVSQCDGFVFATCHTPIIELVSPVTTVSAKVASEKQIADW